MTLDTYPRLSDKALQILAACTEEFRTSQDIAADAGMAGTGLTAWVGAYDRETRAKWRGTGRSDSYWALVDISEQGNAFTASLVDLGYVELRKDNRRVLIKITPKGRQALLASELGQTRIPASNDDDKSLGDEATLQGGKETPVDERSLGDRSTFGGGDGSSLSDLGEFADLPDHDMEIVDLSSRYKIEMSLGKGGMGEVLLATDTRLDRKVAIKRIRGDAGSSKAAVARFLTEAKSIAALSHNNVVQIHDYGRDEQGPFLIMEYVPGGTLLDRCKEGPIAIDEAIDLACQLCDGLGRAHDAGIIHRDIKPANILLTDDSVPKLTDFGLAKAESRDHTMTMAGAVLGTLDFMPPEQRQDASLVDARSDLWSLAATLYQMVTGKSPKIIRFDMLPQSLTNVLGQALEENREDRYQVASKLKEALQQSLRGGNVASVELEQGVCPSCGTRNEASRKFCRNTSCASSLQVKCLSCSATIPVWEGVCGECGSIQTDLLKQCRQEMAAQKAEAEAYLASHDYARANEIAFEINKEADPRLQQLKIWSVDFAEQVESSKRVQVENAVQAIAEALSHEAVEDYRAAIQALEQIPENLRITELEGQQVTAATLLAQLNNKKSCNNATILLSEGSIKKAHRAMEALSESYLSAEQLLFREKLSRLVYKENLIKASVREVNNADGMDLTQVDELLGDVESLIREVPNHQELQEVKKTLYSWKEHFLTRDIATAIANDKTAGLGGLVEQLLAIAPGRDDAIELLRKVKKNERYDKARREYKDRQYDNCIATLAQIDTQDSEASIADLKTAAEKQQLVFLARKAKLQDVLDNQTGIGLAASLADVMAVCPKAFAITDIVPQPELDVVVFALCSSALAREAESDLLGALQILNHVPAASFNKMIVGKNYSVSNMVARLKLKLSKGHLKS